MDFDTLNKDRRRYDIIYMAAIKKITRTNYIINSCGRDAIIEWRKKSIESKIKRLPERSIVLFDSTRAINNVIRITFPGDFYTR